MNRNERIERSLRRWCKKCGCYATECSVFEVHALANHHVIGAPEAEDLLQQLLASAYSTLMVSTRKGL